MPGVGSSYIKTYPESTAENRVWFEGAPAFINLLEELDSQTSPTVEVGALDFTLDTWL